MMEKITKKAILCSLLMSMLFVACDREQECQAPKEDEVKIEMHFSTPVTYAPGNEPADEAIKTLGLLVFKRNITGGTVGSADEALFVESRYAWQKEGTAYNAIMCAGENLDVYFAVNAKNLVDRLIKDEEIKPGETTYAMARKMLILAAPGDIGLNLSAAGIPMWGYVHNMTIKDKALNNLGIIKLLRATASADITVSAPNFNLVKGHIVSGANKGYLPFSSNNVDANLNVNEPEIPDGMSTTADWSFAHADPSSQQIDNVLYMYENDAPVNANRRSTKIVLEGRWSGSKVSANTFYPLAFRDKSTNEKLQIVRNHKYVLEITNVNGDGYLSLDAAKNGEDMNMDYDVISWEDGNDGSNIHLIGTKYISLQSKSAIVQQPKWSMASITMTSNFAIDDFVLKLDNGSHYPDANDKTVVTNSRFRVKLKDEGNEKFTFEFTAIVDYSSSDGTENPTKLTVTAGDVIQFEITIKQQ